MHLTQQCHDLPVVQPRAAGRRTRLPHTNLSYTGGWPKLQNTSVAFYHKWSTPPSITDISNPLLHSSLQGSTVSLCRQPTVVMNTCTTLTSYKKCHLLASHDSTYLRCILVSNVRYAPTLSNPNTPPMQHSTTLYKRTAWKSNSAKMAYRRYMSSLRSRIPCNPPMPRVSDTSVHGKRCVPKTSLHSRSLFNAASQPDLPKHCPRSHKPLET